MAKEKQVMALDDGQEVYTTNKGWDVSKIKEQPVQAAGWKEGANPHFSISKGLMLAVANNQEQFPGIKIGELEGTPIVDPNAINELIIDAFCEKYGLEPATIRVSTSRKASKKGAQLEMLKAMEGAGIGDEVLNALKAKFKLD